MPVRDVDLLAKYWLHEPWGAWRDNLHTAILASEFIRPYLKKGARISLDTFMLRHPDEVAEERQAKSKAAARNLFKVLKAMATKRPYTHG
jgi:hypothetical protein